MDEQPHNIKDYPPVDMAPFGGLQTVSIEPRKPSYYFILSVSGLIIALLILVVFLIQAFKGNAIRTLEEFPVDAYYSNYTSLAGTHFKSKLKVVDQIDWSDKLGKHVVFDIGSTENPIVALIPPEIDTPQLIKGRYFTAELEVKDGGKIEIIKLIEN